MANWHADFLASDPLSVYPFRAHKNGLTFEKPGGEQEAVLQVQPTHYLDNGEYLPIDTLLLVDQPGIFGAPGLSPRILPTGELQFLDKQYRHKTKGVGVLNSGIYTEVQGFGNGSTIDDKLIRDSGTYSHEIILKERGIKEQVILQEKPSNLDGDLFVLETEIFDLNFPTGSFQQGMIYDELVFSGGKAWDANGNEVVVQQTAVDLPGPRIVLFSGVPVGWLDNAVYPVTIDPTYSSQPDESAGYDCGFWSSQPDLNEQYTGHRVGRNGDQGACYVMLIKFDLSSIPGGSEASAATFYITKGSDTASQPLDMYLRRIRRNWPETQATWNSWKTGSAWSTPGALNTTTDIYGDNTGYINWHPADAEHTQKSTALSLTHINYWLKGTLPNYGWRLGNPAIPEQNDFFGFHSSAEPTATYRPKLVITYNYYGRNFYVPPMFI